MILSVFRTIMKAMQLSRYWLSINENFAEIESSEKE